MEDRWLRDGAAGDEAGEWGRIKITIKIKIKIKTRTGASQGAGAVTPSQPLEALVIFEVGAVTLAVTRGHSTRHKIVEGRCLVRPGRATVRRGQRFRTCGTGCWKRGTRRPGGQQLLRVVRQADAKGASR